MKLESKVPTGPIEKSWDKHRFELKLVNPANKRKFKVLVVGTGLAGSSAAAKRRIDNTVMSSSWPNTQAASTICSADGLWLANCCSRSKPYNSPPVFLASTIPSV